MPKAVTAKKNDWHWESPGGECRFWLGDVLEGLRKMPAGSVHCVVTSPPYFGLRAYATGEGKSKEIGSEQRHDCLGWARGENCGECFVCRMVLIFREVHRVLRDDGALFLNLGDSYTGSTPGRYILAIRKAKSRWTYYPIRVRQPG